MLKITVYCLMPLAFSFIFYELYKIYRLLDRYQRRMNIIAEHLQLLDRTSNTRNPHHPANHYYDF